MLRSDQVDYSRFIVCLETAHPMTEDFERISIFLADRLQESLGVRVPESMCWWGWLLVAAVCWYLQLMMSVRTSRGSKSAWVFRIAFIAGTVFSTSLGVSARLGWMWQ